MNRIEISEAISTIMNAMARDDMPQPSFTSQEELKAWKAESAAIEKAGKQAAADLIGNALANLGSLAASLAIMAANADAPVPGTLFGIAGAKSREEAEKVYKDRYGADSSSDSVAG